MEELSDQEMNNSSLMVVDTDSWVEPTFTQGSGSIVTIHLIWGEAGCHGVSTSLQGLCWALGIQWGDVEMWWNL